MTKVIDNFLEPEKFAIIKREIVGGQTFLGTTKNLLTSFILKKIKLLFLPRVF